LRGIERKRNPGSAGVFFEAAPVAFKGKGFTLKNPHRSEQAPPAQQAALPWRKTNLFDGDQPVVVEHMAMDHLNLMPEFSAIRPNILTQLCPGNAILLNRVSRPPIGRLAFLGTPESK
jgi:hypothetical protein